MKKLIALLLLIACFSSVGQVVTTKIVKVTNATTTFNENLLSGIEILNIADTHIYLTLKSIPATKSISTCVLDVDLKELTSTIVKAKNGLIIVTGLKDTIKLGGTLTEPTTITQNGKTFKILDAGHGSVFGQTGIAYTKIDTASFGDSTLITKLYAKKYKLKNDSILGTGYATNYKLSFKKDKNDSILGNGYFTNFKALSKEDKVNKENTTVNNDTIKYPTVNLLKTYADTKAPLFSGTTGFIPKFIGTNTIGNSTVYVDGSNNIGIGAIPNAFLEIAGGVSGRVQVTDGGGNSRKALIIEQPGYGGNAYSRIQTYDYGNNTFPLLSLQTAGGDVQIGSLSGTGTRLVTANSDGTLGVIADGTNGQVLGTDGNGGYSWVNQTGGTETITVQSLSGTSPTWDVTLGKNATITLSGTTTITLSNLVSGTSGNLTVSNPTTSYNITFSGYTIWISQAIYYSGDAVVTSGLGKIDAFSWYYDGNIVLINGQVGYK